jgi:hypothetical protein
MLAPLGGADPDEVPEDVIEDEMAAFNTAKTALGA